MKRRSFLQGGLGVAAEAGASHLTDGTPLSSSMIEDLGRAQMATTYPIPHSTRQTNILVGNGGSVYGPFSSLQIFDIEDVRVYLRQPGNKEFTAVPVTVTKASNLPLDFFTITFPSAVTGTTEFVVSSERIAARSKAVGHGSSVDITALERELSQVAATQQELRRDINRAVMVELGQDPQKLPLPDSTGNVIGWRDGGLANISATEFIEQAGLASQEQGLRADVNLASRAAAISTFHPLIAPDYIRTAGYAVPGDRGGAVYKRVPFQPSHPGTLSITTLIGTIVWYEFTGDEVTLFQLGAKGDATPFVSGSGADDTVAWNDTAAVAVALKIPMKVPFLPSNKAFRLTTRTDYPSEITIKGDGADVTVGFATNFPNGGAWVYLDHLHEGFYFRDDDQIGASKKFARLKGVGVVRNQPPPRPGWAPLPAAHDLRVEYNVDLEDTIFLSSSKIAIVRSAGLLQTRRVRGQPLIVGYECERSSDVQRWDGDHWWPYWSQDQNVKTYTIANALGYKVRRADGLMITNPFGIWYKRLFYAEDAKGDGSGLANFHIANAYADVGGGAIEIVSEYYAAYGSVTGYLCNSSIDGAPSEGAAFRLRGAAPSQINLEMRSNRSPEEAVYVSGAAHRIRLNAGHIEGWSYVKPGRYALKATDGAVIDVIHEADFALGNGLFYTHDHSSRIIFPIKFDLAKSAASETGFYSRRVSVEDDAVGVVAVPSGDKTCNLHITPTAVPSNGNPAGSIWGRATENPSASPISLSHTANVTVTTGVLTGTTGIDGNLTISFANDGNIYIENRTGSIRTYILTLLGN